MSKPGAWALEAEQAEAEEREAAAAAAAAQSQSFPSLKEAAAAAAKPKKKKPVPIPLAQFAADPHVGHTPDADLLSRLPTRPRDRPPDYDHHLDFSALRRGGGSGGGGFRDEPRRGPPQPRAQDMDLPSRADEVDNWAATKRQLAPPSSSSSVVDRGRSRADEVDNWAAGKKPIQNFGSGFRTSSGSDSDRWVRGGGLSSSDGERKRLVLDLPKKDGGNVRSEWSRPSPFGAARPREEVLAEKGVDWGKIDLEIESKKATSRPSSSHSQQSYLQSSRPSSAQSGRAESPGGQAGPRTRVNPFGDAKPREVLLEAKGKDWRKIDLELEHRGIDRPETDEEKLLKEEINNLKSQAKSIEENLKSEGAQFSAEELASLQEQIFNKERELEILTCQLDDKVRFGEKAATNSRPNSGGRPHSRSSIPEEPRSLEFMERPRSHGGMVNKRGGFQVGFFSDRNMERSISGGRW